MFKLFTRRKVSPTDLLTSKLYNETTFYPTFLRDLKKCQKEVIIESPYMTTARTRQLLPTFQKLVKRGVRVTVRTRYPGHHDQLLRIQAWMVTKELKQIGVKVRFFNNHLHRKLAVLDGVILYEGSLNILSQNDSCEILRRMSSSQIAHELLAFLDLGRFV